MNFKISALSINTFAHLFGQNNEALAEQGIYRITVEDSPGFPCRVSMRDAEVGETVLLMNYQHQAESSPFQSSHAIYVRENAAQAIPDINEVPTMLRGRLLSARGFDDSAMITDADVAEGENVEQLLERLLENQSTRYVHIHNARLGCYLASADRA